MSPNGTGFFALNALNIGPPATITFTPTDTAIGQPAANLPLTKQICQVNAATGACINPSTPGPSSTVSLGTNESTNFAVFFVGQGQCISFDIPNHRGLVIATQGGIPVSQTGNSINMQAAGCPPTGASPKVSARK
jgi:hypothetical protein